MYGPFHRLKSPTQSDDDAYKQEVSGELWGRPRRGSDIPQVQAYTGPLPDGEEGIEFFSAAQPDTSAAPGQARWTGPRDGVAVDHIQDFAKIKIELSKNTQLRLISAELQRRSSSEERSVASVSR